MSFIGLDFSPGLNAYAELLRKADEDSRKIKRNQELDRMRRYKAGLDGYPVEEDLYVPIDNPGINEQEVYSAAAKRGPANNKPTSDLIAEMEAAKASGGLDQLQSDIANSKAQGARAPMRGKAADIEQKLGRPVARKQDISKVPQAVEGLAKEYERLIGSGIIKTEEEKKNLIKSVSQDAIKVLVQQGLISGKAKVDTNGKYIVSPDLAKEIRDIREKERKSMLKAAGSNQLGDMAMAILLSAGRNEVKPKSSSKAPDPTLAKQRQLNYLRGLLTDKPKKPTGYMARFEMPQYEADLASWEEENADVLSQIDSLRSGVSRKYTKTNKYSPDQESMIKKVMDRNNTTRAKAIEALKRANKL